MNILCKTQSWVFSLLFLTLLTHKLSLDNLPEDTEGTFTNSSGTCCFCKAVISLHGCFVSGPCWDFAFQAQIKLKMPRIKFTESQNGLAWKGHESSSHSTQSMKSDFDLRGPQTRTQEFCWALPEPGGKFCLCCPHPGLEQAGLVKEG